MKYNLVFVCFFFFFFARFITFGHLSPLGISLLLSSEDKGIGWFCRLREFEKIILFCISRGTTPLGRNKYYDEYDNVTPLFFQLDHDYDREHPKYREFVEFIRSFTTLFNLNLFQNNEWKWEALHSPILLL